MAKSRVVILSHWVFFIKMLLKHSGDRRTSTQTNRWLQTHEYWQYEYANRSKLTGKCASIHV